MDGNGPHFLLLLVVLLSWLYTAGDRGPVRLGNPYKREQSTSTTKRHHLSTCSLGQHCMNQRPLQGPSVFLRCLFSLNFLFPFSLFYSMLPFLSFIDLFFQHILKWLVLRETQSSQNPLFIMSLLCAWGWPWASSLVLGLQACPWYPKRTILNSGLSCKVNGELEVAKTAW